MRRRGNAKLKPIVPYIFTVDTNFVGATPSNQFELVASSAIPNQPFSYVLKTSDGQTITRLTGPHIITFPTAGVYDIEVYSRSVIFITHAQTLDKNKIIDGAKQWGDLKWGRLSATLRICENMSTVSAIDAPDLSLVTKAEQFISQCIVLNSINYNNWDTSNIQNFTSFQNQNTILTSVDVGGFNTSSATSMNLMFWRDFELTNIGDITNWQVGNVTTFFRFLADCRKLTFVGTLASWNLINCTTTQEMFDRCWLLSGIDTSSWNTSNVLNMSDMFRQFYQYDSDMSGWVISQVTNFTGFMTGCNGLSTPNYNATLIGWAAQIPLAYNGTLDFGGSQYDSSIPEVVAARDALIADVGAIIDGGPVI